MMLQLPIYCIMREILRRMKQEDTDHIGMQQHLDENVVEKKERKKRIYSSLVMTTVYIIQSFPKNAT